MCDANRTGWFRRLVENRSVCRHANNDNPQGPHFKLSSGRHADTYFNAAWLIENHEMWKEVCGALLLKARQQLLNVSGSGSYSIWGPESIGALLADELAKQVGCGFGVVKKNDTGLYLADQPMSRERIILVDDAITTGGSVRRSINLLENAGATVLPLILCFVNWGEPEIDGRPVISLVEGEMQTWKPDNCPLCAMGSEAVRPKKNWRRLVFGADF